MSADGARSVCPRCKNYASDPNDADGNCYWCQKVVKNEKIAEAKEFEVHGVKVRPTFVSGTSHRHCNSVQGWVCDSGPFNNRYGNRAKSKKQLVDRIEAVWKSWNENGAVQESTGARNELRMLWGDNPASLEADKKIAQKQKEIEAQRAAYIAREGAEKILRDAGPAMLEALKYVDRVLRSNNWDRADYHTGGPTMAVHVRAAIKKAETGE